jgi:hypothetical protein
VRVRLERGLPHAAQQLEKRRIAGDVGPHDQRVHEKADEPLELGVPPAGNGASNDEVRLRRVPVKQHLERRKQRHEQRGTVLTSELAQPVDEYRRQRHRPVRAAIALHRGTRAIGRKVQDCCFQYASCLSSTSPWSHSRCQAA